MDPVTASTEYPLEDALTSAEFKLGRFFHTDKNLTTVEREAIRQVCLDSYREGFGHARFIYAGH